MPELEGGVVMRLVRTSGCFEATLGPTEALSGCLVVVESLKRLELCSGCSEGDAVFYSGRSTALIGPPFSQERSDHPFRGKERNGDQAIQTERRTECAAGVDSSGRPGAMTLKAGLSVLSAAAFSPSQSEARRLR
jgi:hypothetical protein